MRSAGDPAQTVKSSSSWCRDYDVAIDDVWRALTEPGLLRRWFLPVSGDLRPGGAFQTEGNVGGEIRRCESPRLLNVTWGEDTSVLELRLSLAGVSATTFELEHTVPLDTAGSGAGSLFVGPGWDSALMALGQFLLGQASDDPAPTASSTEFQQFAEESLVAWVGAVETSGTATADELAAAAEAALAHWVPDMPERIPKIRARLPARGRPAV